MTAAPIEQPLVISRGDMEAPQVFGIAGGEAAVFSASSPTRPGENQDGVALLPLGGTRAVLAVADGLGGQPSGDKAADLSLSALADHVARADHDDAGGLRTAVLNGFEQANERVAEMGIGAATTLAAVELEAGQVRPYHVGDSAILVVGQRGKVKLRTVDHSPVGYAVEAGLMDESEAIHHEDRHLVSNIVGSPEMRIEVGRTLRLAAFDTLVIGSDGLFDNMHVAEIADLVRKGPLADAAAALIETCRRRMEAPVPDVPSKPDDLTFVIWRAGRNGRGSDR